MDIRFEKREHLQEKPDQKNLGFGKHFTDYMFVMDWDKEQGWHDAAIVPYGGIPMDPATMVLHYAQETFEGLKAYRTAEGKIQLFRPEMNARRMIKSNERLCMPGVPEEMFVEAVKAHLEAGKMAGSFEVPDDEDAQIWFKGYNLLTAKPTIYAANVAEDDLADDGASNPHVAKVREMAKEEGAEVFVICAQIEQELAELDEDEKKEYLDDLGVTSSGLDKLVAASYSLLGLISFLTAGEDECRAWTIKKGTKAPQAAGKIHTDFERGFIKAEVVNYQDLLDNGSLAAAREKGIVGMEGKEYVVKDGDVILFRFNV